MEKAIETPAEAGGDVAEAPPHTGGPAASSEAGSSASVEEVVAPGVEAAAEDGREKAVVRRPRRPRRTKPRVQAEGEGAADAAEAVAPPEATLPPLASANGEVASGDGSEPPALAEATVASVDALASSSPGNGSAAVESGEATPAEGEPAAEKRRRRRPGGRRKAAVAESVAEDTGLEGDVASADAIAVDAVPSAEAAAPVESPALPAPGREAAEPISAGRPEIEIEPPMLPDAPDPDFRDAEAELLTIDLLPEPSPEELEAVPPDLPQPPARERGRRRRSRAERAAARARATSQAPAVEMAPEPEVESVTAAVAPAPEAPPKETRGRGRKRDKPEVKEKVEARDTIEPPVTPAVREKVETREKPEKVEKLDNREGEGRRRGDASREQGERAAERGDREKLEKLVKEIIVNVDSRETRIAVIENNRLVELHVEREERVVGSVYKGRVANVLPGMDAAFVDIGLERNAFLYVGDILYEAGGGGGGDDEGGPVYRRAGREVKIRDVAKSGQEILVQVVKGPRGTKGARVSTRMSLPGRYIVLMPEAENLGVSRKIEDAGERERLRKIGEAVRPSGFGMIIRTEAEGKTERDLRQDAQLLVDLWRKVQEKARKTPPPGQVHQDLSLLFKTIRDVFGSDVDRMLIDSASDHQKAVELLSALSPELMERVDYYAGPEPIFHKFGLDDEIERLLRRKVWLKSGGYITIDSTEALTAVDVNTGKFVGSTSLSDAILKTNLDAVNEIVRQLRLRDLGGMIVLDFIDMNSARDRAQVMAALERGLKKDRTRTKIAHISPLGLVEMTRKRTGETVTELLTQSCPYCQGRGRVSSPESVSIQIERLVKRRCSEGDVDAILVYANPEVAAYMVGPEGDNIEQLEKEVRRPVYVRARHDYHVEKFEIVPGDMMELEHQIMPYRGGQVVECVVQKLDLITAPRSGAWVDGFFVDLANGTRFQGQKTKVRLVDVRRSFALGEPVSPAHTLDKSEPI